MTYLDITHLQAHIEQLTNENERLSSEGRRLNKALDKIHALAVTQWSAATADGWLKIMQHSDPGARVSEGQTKIGCDIYSCGCKYPGGTADRTFEVRCPTCYSSVEQGLNQK